ncbi:FMN-binding protein [Micromonospora sp. AMSO12t]|uniref:FMN-binding protein n=1 Tax=unclassified Micromonospora TaxID=2617518 RepID=UPI00124B9D4E|nr:MULTISPECIES: FMN-binding protein [unclassified Micromonospora]KAB1152035.1 FMN-binding protein [Micromonospora sp. AMSO12t]WSG01937.1 FMN-binding protein [Micromonospora sp. NBC_01740]
MRRALLAITGLAAGTTAMVVLKGSPGTSPVAQDLPAAPPPVVPAPAGPAPGGGEVSAPPSPARTSASPRPGRTATRAPASRPSVTSRAPSAPRTTTKPPPAPTTRTVTGPVVENEYGNVQVQITLSGTRIVDVVALELPEETAQSDQRSEQVDGRYSGGSGLVVQRQSADVDTVSGATATSTSYKQSLQAAIDRAR